MSKTEFYRQVLMQVEALCSGEPNLIANLANTSAALFNQMEDVNWVGFYLMADSIDEQHKELVLGPFQGQAACVRIPVGKGVCGTAVAEKKALLVEDVHQFDGHIACDAASNSEIVIPLVHGDRVVAVLDIDSPSVGRFCQQDMDGLLKIAQFLESIW